MGDPNGSILVQLKLTSESTSTTWSEPRSEETRGRTLTKTLMLLVLAYFYMNNYFYNTEHRSISKDGRPGSALLPELAGPSPLHRVPPALPSKLLECIVSIAMLLFVLYDLVRRLGKEFRLSFYAVIEVAMILTLVCRVPFTQPSPSIPWIPISASSTFLAATSTTSTSPSSYSN